MRTSEIDPVVENERAPDHLRDGVRAGILASIRRDVELQGGRTARLLVAAGVVGVLGALGVTLLVARHPFGHHPQWHLAVFSTVWAGLLIVSLSVAFLRVRTPSLPLARAATVGLLALGLAGLCGTLCPDPHFLGWWSGTGAGAGIAAVGGPALGAACFGLATTVVFGALSALLVLGERGHPPVSPLLPAAVLLALLAPGILLQSVGTSFGVAAGWLAGAALGGYVGIAGGARARRLLTRA